ncbi:MAG: hypothetical protein QNJ17_12575 [Desulfocapsaceae bacterium]|nr:hypothetical protein [Desulfocapsaceae bacterium]
MIVHASRCKIVGYVLALSFLIALFTTSQVYSTQIFTTVPGAINTSAKYLFFLHNYYVEKNGPDGDCKYNDLLNTFADEGYVVISEVRQGKIIPCTYAEKITAEVKKLLDVGVPAKNIIVSGHSKGGAIALCVASQLNNENINYVIMAGCEIAGIKKHSMYPDFANLKGHILSVYAGSDTIAGSCSQSFTMAGVRLDAEEMVLTSEKGHRLFFSPDEVWSTPVLGWLNETK